MKARTAVVAVAFATALALWWSLPSTPRAQTAARVDAPVPAAARVSSVLAAKHAGTKLGTFSREDSLRDTAVDGAVHLDASKRPLADRDLRHLFDYFLARLGERDERAIRADLLAHLRNTLNLDAAAQAQVLDWFDAYVAVERAASALPRSGDLAADAKRLRTLHRARLGDELAQAWYGTEDDYAAYTAQRLAIEHDTVLGASEKAQRLGELEATLNPQQRESLRSSTDFQIALAQSAQLDDQAADASTRYVDRAALWGEDAATRLAALDQSEADWSDRLAGYARARASALADSALSPAAREARLAALLAGFSESERRRVLSLAQANALPH